MKLHFTRESPKTKYHREYRQFDIDYSSSEPCRQLDSTFSSLKENDDWGELYEFSRFHRVFLNLLNFQEPLKKNILRVNNSPFMTKTLRSRLKNRFNKIRSYENWTFYKTQRNFGTKLLRKTKKVFYSKVNPKLVSDNKNFRRTFKPSFSDKGSFSNKIVILEKRLRTF